MTEDAEEVHLVRDLEAVKLRNGNKGTPLCVILFLYILVEQTGMVPCAR